MEFVSCSIGFTVDSNLIIDYINFYGFTIITLIFFILDWNWKGPLIYHATALFYLTTATTNEPIAAYCLVVPPHFYQMRVIKRVLSLVVTLVIGSH